MNGSACVCILIMNGSASSTKVVQVTPPKGHRLPQGDDAQSAGRPLGEEGGTGRSAERWGRAGGSRTLGGVGSLTPTGVHQPHTDHTALPGSSRSPVSTAARSAAPPFCAAEPADIELMISNSSSSTCISKVFVG